MALGPVYSFPGVDSVLSWVRSGLISILKTGPVPKHIAFVMDGNRRYARKHSQEYREGHNAGFETLVHALELCYNAGVDVVTVFAFSIENFNRTQHEVDSLMEVAKSRLSQIVDNGELAQEYGIKIRVVGDRSMLPPDVITVVKKAEAVTANNSKALLNICFPYTSRDEITAAIRTVVSEAEQGNLNSEQVSEAAIDKATFFASCPPLDILVRTSGVRRFSDFMLWQAHQGTSIEFTDKLWPEFGFFDVYMILLRWSLKRAREIDD